MIDYDWLSVEKQKVIEELELGLQELAQKSPTARALYHFYLANRMVASTTGAATAKEIWSFGYKRTKDYFLVAVTQDESDYQRFAPQSAIMCSIGRVIILRSDPCSPFIRALYLCHEMGHVINNIVREYQGGTGQSGYPFKDEVDFYDLQRWIMNQYTGWEYDRALLQHLEPTKTAYSKIASNPRVILVDQEGLGRLFKFPLALSKMEETARETLFVLHMGFKYIEKEFGGKRGLVLQKKLEVIQDVYVKDGIPAFSLAK
jgi:hypothetical protein